MLCCIKKFRHKRRRKVKDSAPTSKITKKEVLQINTPSNKTQVLEVGRFMASNYRSRDIEKFIKKKSDGCSQTNTGCNVAKWINEAESINNAAPVKSNLKKNTLMMEMNPELSTRTRKVSWSDAHGKDIAHVQEFEPSEEGELGGVGNSCRCAIQ